MLAVAGLAAPALADWTASPQSMGLAGQVGQGFPYQCPPTGAVSQVIWGSGHYTSDSAICPAAVHAGRIDVAPGGVVSVVVTGPQTAYGGISRFGVTSNAYGAWDQSYGFR
ncbi:hypothetical protein roselon_03316 [Roseibacterium elongatum DSM 19469]|uniref:LCCL domain-containing protein n=2 Tax=Roseicyclus elongatus TaxID=159346 RepID=W8RWJ9_9RHOB|nr:hypothetical protein roselon_03316 [Roseibacterium elongatum DSM 19469]